MGGALLPHVTQTSAVPTVLVWNEIQRGPCTGPTAEAGCKLRPLNKSSVGTKPPGHLGPSLWGTSLSILPPCVTPARLPHAASRWRCGHRQDVIRGLRWGGEMRWGWEGWTPGSPPPCPEASVLSCFPTVPSSFLGPAVGCYGLGAQHLLSLG